jgi:hypothetical protein
VSDLFFGEFSTDVTPPALTNASPPNLDTEVAQDAAITFDLTDLESGVDTSQVTVDVNGTDAFSGGSTQNGFGGLGLVDAGGGVWQMNLTPPTGTWDSYLTVTVTVTAQDLAPVPNVMTPVVWSFEVEDYEPPYVDAGWAPTGTGVPTSTLITFALKDDGVGVDLTKTVVRVGGVVAYDGGAGGFQGDFVGGASAVDAGGAPNVYGFTIDKTPDYDEWTAHLVEVESRDLR